MIRKRDNKEERRSIVGKKENERIKGRKQIDERIK